MIYPYIIKGVTGTRRRAISLHEYISRTTDTGSMCNRSSIQVRTQLFMSTQTMNNNNNYIFVDLAYSTSSPTIGRRCRTGTVLLLYYYSLRGNSSLVLFIPLPAILKRVHVPTCTTFSCRPREIELALKPFWQWQRSPFMIGIA